MTEHEMSRRVREIHDIATRALSVHAKPRRRPGLLRELAGLAGETPDIWWQEAYVVLLVLGRQKPVLAFRLLDRLRHRRAAAGEADDHRAFCDRIDAYLAPERLTAHGFRTPFAARDQSLIWTEFDKLADRLRGLGLRFFLNSGTLLGMQRDGALIGHDDDMDLAVILNVSRREDVADAWMHLRDRLDRAGLLVRQDSDVPLILKLRSDTGVDVDLFPAWMSGDAAYVFPHTHGDLSRRDILPLATCPVSGHRIPARPEAVLEKNYGSAWRTPDPNYRFPWARQARLFDDIIQQVDATAPIREAAA